MKIQCDVCERAEAAILCCADEAALCWACDDKVHAANKLASKHQRVPLLSNHPNGSKDQAPTCDICQEKAGYFFCLEDRALLCRQCDVAIHTASPYVSGHQRFLITGIRVALQQYFTSNSYSPSSNSNCPATSSTHSDNSKYPASSTGALSDSLANKKMQPASASPVVGEVDDFRSQWPWTEIMLESAELDQCYGFSEPGSSS